MHCHELAEGPVEPDHDETRAVLTADIDILAPMRSSRAMTIFHSSRHVFAAFARLGGL
jgi:hypothetical protein